MAPGLFYGAEDGVLNLWFNLHSAPVGAFALVERKVIHRITAPCYPHTV